MKPKEKETVSKNEVLVDFSVESSTVDVESLGEVTVKVKW